MNFPSNFTGTVNSMFTSRSILDDSILLSFPAFSARRLEGAIKLAIKSFCTETECKSRRKQGQSTARTYPHEDTLLRDNSCTKTFVRNHSFKTASILYAIGWFWQSQKTILMRLQLSSRLMIRRLHFKIAQFGKPHGQRQQRLVSSNR